MRISHSEWADLQRDVKKWLLAKAAATARGRKMGYAQAVKLGIYKFHSVGGNKQVSLHHFDQLAARNFKNAARVTQARLQLEAYADWYEGSGVVVSEHRVRVALTLYKETSLVGEISRIDHKGSANYRAVLLMDEIPVDWKSELRMPLLQQAIANRCDRHPDDFAVAVQNLDGSNLDEVQFDEVARQEATDTAIALAKRIERHKKR